MASLRRHIVFTHLGVQPQIATAPTAPPPTAVVLMLDSTVGSVTGPDLAQGSTYTVTVTGTVSNWNAALTKGTPEPNAEYPSSTTGRKSTQVGLDAETLFAQPANFSHPFGHSTQFEMNLGGGWLHVEPEGGPFSKPQPGHAYTYTVAGEGKPIMFRWSDSPLSDNYGRLRIEIT